MFVEKDLAAASERLRGVSGFPRKRGRPRKTPMAGGTETMPPRPKSPQHAAPAVTPTENAHRKRGAPPLGIAPRLFSTRRSACYLGVGPASVRALVENGELARVVLPGISTWLFDRNDLDALIERAKHTAPPENNNGRPTDGPPADRAIR